MYEKFDLSKINSIDDGRIKAALEQQLARCEADCKDRPMLKKARKVTLQVEMRPLPDGGAELDSVDVAFQIKAVIPPQDSKNYNMKATRGGLVYNDLSPDDINQMTIDQAPQPRSTDAS